MPDGLLEDEVLADHRARTADGRPVTLEALLEGPLGRLDHNFSYRTISPRHFCLHVENAELARTELAANGLKIDETVKIAAADRFFIRDPDGNRIELLQWLRPYHPETDGQFAS